MSKFSEATKQKLGNAIVYIAKHTSSLSKTKLLKLLYLMEERMALKYHVPFIGLPFEVWQAGPVAKDVFIDLSDGPFLLKDFVKTSYRDGGIFVEAKTDFDDSEFSECEIALMDEVLAKYGSMTASERNAVASGCGKGRIAGSLPKTRMQQFGRTNRLCRIHVGLCGGRLP